MSILVDIKPRQDNRFDIYVSDDNGDQLLNSNQGYENVEDAKNVARRLFGKETFIPGFKVDNSVRLTVHYRDGDTKSEQIR